MHIDLDKFERIERIGFNFDGNKIKGIRLYSPKNDFIKTGEYFIDSIWDTTQLVDWYFYRLEKDEEIIGMELNEGGPDRTHTV